MKKILLILLTLLCITLNSFLVLADESVTQKCSTQQKTQSETIIINGYTYVKQNESHSHNYGVNEKSENTSEDEKQKKILYLEDIVAVCIIVIIILFYFVLLSLC